MRVLTLDPSIIAVDNHGLQKLVILTLLVPLRDPCYWVISSLTLAGNQGLQCNLHALPPLITVHGIITADNGRNLCLALKTQLLDLRQEFSHVGLCALRVGISAITEEVNVDVGNAKIAGSLEELVKVLVVGVNTAVGDQTEEVKAAVGVFGVLK